MSRGEIDDRVLRIFVGVKCESGVLNTAMVRGVVSRMAADIRAPASTELAGFLELEDLPQERRSQFMMVLDTMSKGPLPKPDSEPQTSQ